MALRRRRDSRLPTAAAAAVIALAGAVAGCYSPTIVDGSLACADGKYCPRGFVCRESDKLCHLTQADAAAEKVGDAAVEGAPADARDAAIENVPMDAGDAAVESTPMDARDAAVESAPVVDARDAAIESAPVDAHDAPVESVPVVDARDAPVETPTGLKSNGSACAQSTECVSEYCVDGVCCNTACTERCKACDIATSRGTCTQVTSDQPRGTRGACGGSGACAGACSAASPTACTFPGDETTCRSASCASATFTARGGCNGAGACSNVVTMSCGEFMCNASGSACLTACTSDNQCATTARPYCDGGACVIRRANGARCQAAAECTSQRCVDGTCCNDACQGSCQACDVAGHLGACWPVPSGTPYGGRPQCGGTGACAGSCNGLAAGQCFFPGAERSCNCPTSGIGGTCDGTGACQVLIGLCI